MSDALETRLLEITEVFARGDVEVALEQLYELEQTCRTPREKASVLSRYVTFFHLLEMHDEELTALAQALSIDPHHPRANYLQAVNLMSDERWDDAVISLNIAARNYPPDDKIHLAEVYGNLSYCWSQLKDPDRAAMYAEICEDLDPEGFAAFQEGFDAPDEVDDDGFLPGFDVPEDDEAPCAADDDEHQEALPPSAELEQRLEALGARPHAAARPESRPAQASGERRSGGKTSAGTGKRAGSQKNSSHSPAGAGKPGNSAGKKTGGRR